MNDKNGQFQGIASNEQ